MSIASCNRFFSHKNNPNFITITKNYYYHYYKNKINIFSPLLILSIQPKHSTLKVLLFVWPMVNPLYSNEIKYIHHFFIFPFISASRFLPYYFLHYFPQSIKYHWIKSTFHHVYSPHICDNQCLVHNSQLLLSIIYITLQVYLTTRYKKKKYTRIINYTKIYK